ncbi:MAG: nucleotidyl transferase AbiEii/AbiGii toxin family protein [Deltaproteobacteria bacterium]|nr:nucleotidyl transferase AbiEii/AbiGii toxin family protein [Deltaproteobacteria bacterium]
MNLHRMLMDLSDRQAVEHFHLQLVRSLASGPDKAHLAVKGGCNLRFFFGSVRYSEDMDLDVARDLEPHLLKEKMNRLLTGAALKAALRPAGIELAMVSAPKQTETTQRWKAELRVRGRSVALHTKVEFSRRPTTEEAVLGALAPNVLQEHELLPLLARHYPLNTAIRQKVQALVGRRIVQARDVFDLAVLFTRAGGKVDALASERAILPLAIERAMDVSFDDYQGQVVAYLAPEYAVTYQSREAWDALQAQVIEALERATS